MARLFHKGKRLKSFADDVRGFTLVEMLVAVSLLTVVTGVLGSGLFQASRFQKDWRARVTAVKEWRRAETWLTGDAFNAQTTSLIDGAAAANTVVLTWSNGGAPHTATYSVSGTELTRVFDGQSLVVARGVASAGFSRSGNLLTFDLSVTADKGSVDQVTVKTYLRMLQ